MVLRHSLLIKRGYTPKVAVELALQETEVEHRNDPRIMEKARADAEDFLLRARKGPHLKWDYWINSNDNACSTSGLAPLRPQSVLKGGPRVSVLLQIARRAGKRFVRV
jgi:hypothetical protein